MISPHLLKQHSSTVWLFGDVTKSRFELQRSLGVYYIKSSDVLCPTSVRSEPD